MGGEMVQSRAEAVITEDGKGVICISRDGRVRWQKGVPLLSEWQRLIKREFAVDLENGQFQYADNESHGEIVAVFTPYGSLDFNLTYDALSGDLLKIDESR